MVSLLVFLFILGLLIIVHEFGHFILAKRAGVRVEEFSLGFGPRLLNKRIGVTDYNLNAIPLGGYVKLAGESRESYNGNSDEYLSKSVFQRCLIIFFGPLLNYALGFLFFWLIFFAGYPALTTRVGGLIEGLGAKSAGIQAGDRIMAVDSASVKSWEDLQEAIQRRKTQEKVSLSILRDSEERTIEVKLGQQEVSDVFGKKRAMALLGITPFQDEVIKVRHGFIESFFLSGDKVLDLTLLTYKSIFMLASGRLSMRESVTGPLGIFYITSKAASVGIIAVLHLIALLSISLAIFNLLPLPVLDGGHILLLAVEKIRGRKLSVKAERVIMQTGLALIISLTVLVTYNDLVRFFGDRISKLFK